MKENKDVKIEVKVDENIATGIFSNFANMTYTPEEFILDFLFVHPTPPPGFGKLMSRLLLTPAHTKRLAEMLTRNVAEYEDRFGEIKINNRSIESESLQ
jgi:uncharacterized protein DUF3467